MHTESRRYIGQHEIKVGARIPVHSGLNREPVSIEAVCDALSPDSWNADLKFFGQTVISVAGYDTPDKAARAAEDALAAKLASLLRD